MKKGFCLALFIAAASLVWTACSVVSAQDAPAPKKAKNVILMIGDGMGINSDTAGTYYRFGEKQAQKYHQFRFLASSTFSLKRADFDEDKDTGYVPEKFWADLKGGEAHTEDTAVTDSAASGTALNSGRKTYNGRIGEDFSGNPFKLFGDLAATAGKSVGAVSTVQIANATPAAVKAHQFTRSLLKEISREQILDQSGLTVLMGAGHPEYKQGTKIDKPAEELDYENVGGRYVWEALKSGEIFERTGTRFIEKKADFEKLAGATPDKKEIVFPKRLVAVARESVDIFPIDGAPDGDQENANYKEMAGDDVATKVAELPTLSDMAIGALNMLSRNENGFYLMVEGGAIDHANHGNNIKQSVLEHTGFTKAIDTVINWVETYSNWDETLLIITADHETGQMWGEGTYEDANNNNRPEDGEQFNGFQHIKNNGKGQVPGVQYATGGHSNGFVPVWINGAGAEVADQFIRGTDEKAAEFFKEDGFNFDGKFIYNSDIGRIMKAATGLTEEKK